MISRKLIESVPFLRLGEERSLNHEGCKAGEDTKHRLYIKRVVGGRLAYCHHCNEHGFVRELNSDGTKLRQWLFGKEEDLKKVYHHRGLDTIPLEIKNRTTISSPVVLDWLHQHKIPLLDRDFTQGYGYESLVFPLRNHNGTICGYQVRTFNPKRPKYLTHIFGDTDAAWFTSNISPYLAGTHKLTIVEDYVSGYRIKRDTNSEALALLRTSMSDEALAIVLSRNYLQINVWLDPDEAGRKASAKLVSRLKAVFAGHVWEIRMSFEPKETTPKILGDTLNG